MTTPDEIAAGVDAALAKLAGPAPRAHTNVIAMRPASDDVVAKYVAKAVQAECDRIVTAPMGDQNNTINRAAFSLGQLVAVAALTEDEARAQLLAAAVAGNHPERRAQESIASGLTAGMRLPRTPWPPVSHRDDTAELHRLIAPDDGQSIDWSDTDEPPAEDDEPSTQQSAPLPGRLPEEFWNARPLFAHIRQAAHAKACSGDVAFYSFLARLSGMLSHNIRAETGVGTRASLNVFAAVVGPPGAGKSTGASVARSLMLPPDDDFRDGLPIGSGEGIAEVFMGTVEEETGETRKGKGGTETPVTRKVRRQVRHNAFFYADEGETLAKLSERNGSTLPETLRRAAVGEALGQTNATEERTRYIPEASYSLGLLVGFQPSSAGPVLADSSTGTPQRFLWGWAIDPTIPDEPPLWPGAFVHHAGLKRPDEPVDVTFPKDICQQLRREHLAKARGEVEVAELDAHAPLMRVKLAALLALLDDRMHVSQEDWDLAGVIWASSCAVRNALVERALRDAAAERQRQDEAKVLQEVRAHEAKGDVDRAIARVARFIARKASEDKDGITYSALNRAMASRDRPVLRKALDYAEVQEWVSTHGDRIFAEAG